MKSGTNRPGTSVPLVRVGIIILVIAAVAAAIIIATRPGQFDAEAQATLQEMAEQPADYTFIVCTDLHYDPSKEEPQTLQPTMDCVRMLKQRTKIDALWNLGDLINGHNTTKAEATKQLNTVIAAQEAVTADYHNIEGNHDNNIQSTYPSNTGYGMEEVLTNEELNGILQNTKTTQQEHHSPLRPTDYYVDYDRLRVVCLTAEYTTWTKETAEWLRTTALKTELPVLILAHCPTRPEWGFQNDIRNGEEIEAALQDFIQNNGTIIAYIHGHDHGDMIRQVYREDGSLAWHSIAIGCARFQKPTSNGTPDMTFRDRYEKDETEVLFDVVSINLKERTVRFTRFGAGENREITY